MVIHVALLRAVHVHPVIAETVTVALLASEPSDWLTGDSVKRHGAASCMTRTRLSLMTISASRDVGTVLGVTRKSTAPVPWPDVGDRSVIQFA
jgi:hypothetical protein